MNKRKRKPKPVRQPLIDTAECVGCGNCEAICPAAFHLNKKLGYSEVIDPPDAPEERIQEAIDQCPAQCIYWEDEF